MTKTFLKFGEILRRRRIELGFTQSDISNGLGIKSVNISDWEREEGMPESSRLPELARKLKLTISELMGEFDYRDKECQAIAPVVETSPVINDSDDVIYSVEHIDILFGERIKVARESAGMNQTDLSGQMNVSPQAIQKWESGKSSPRLSRIYRLATVLGVNISYLLPSDPTTMTFDSEQARIRRLAERLTSLPTDKLRAISVIVEVAL